MSDPVVAIIPARGGSKGISRKNLRKVGGISLVERSILHAKMSRRIERIVVTSEDAEIQWHAKQAGAEVVERPEALATDDANGDAVIVHALQAIGVSTGLTVFLQPTSPLRPPGIIDRCIIELELRGYDSVFTACEGHFAWHLFQPFDASKPIHAVPFGQTVRLPRQQIPANELPWLENGSVYVSKTDQLIAAYNRLCGLIGIVPMKSEDSIDVDTEHDLWLAENRLAFLDAEREKRRAAANANANANESVSA